MSKQNTPEDLYVTETLFSGDPDAVYAGGPGERLTEVVKWYAQKLAKIPTDCQESARAVFEIFEDYDSHRVHLDVYYRRPMTPGEIAEAKEWRQQQSTQIAENEKSLLKELLAKYPEGVN